MNSRTQTNLNISESQLLLINVLNTMYNDNLRQINSLTTSNNEIRQIITNLLSNTNQHNSRVRNRYSSNRGGSTRNAASYSSGERIYINNLPYIIEDVRELRVPYSQLNNWINPGDSPSVDSSANYFQPTTFQPTTYSNQTRNGLFSSYQRFLDPVEVFPTQSQIENATRRAVYCDIVSPINRSCPISLDNFNDNDTVSVIRHCGHIFNTENLNRWFRTNCRCPVCRYDIRDYLSRSSTNLFNNSETNETSTHTSSTPTSSTSPLNESINNNSTYDNRNVPVTRLATNHYNNSFFNNIINDISLQDIENIGSIFIDSSGNFMRDVSDPNILFTLLNTLNNNRNQT